MTTESSIANASAVRFSLVLVNVLYWLAWIGAGIGILVMIAFAFGSFDSVYIWLPLEAEFSSGESVSSLSSSTADGISIVGFSQPKVPLNQLDSGYLLIVLPLIVVIAAALWLFHSLRRFLRNVRAGQIFAAENPGLLNRVGWIVVVAGPALGIIQLILGLSYLSLLDFPGVSISVDADFHWEMVLAGLVILVIAKVYDVAVQMKADAELTV